MHALHKCKIIPLRMKTPVSDGEQCKQHPLLFQPPGRCHPAIATHSTLAANITPANKTRTKQIKVNNALSTFNFGRALLVKEWAPVEK